MRMVEQPFPRLLARISKEFTKGSAEKVDRARVAAREASSSGVMAAVASVPLETFGNCWQ